MVGKKRMMMNNFKKHPNDNRFQDLTGLSFGLLTVMGYCGKKNRRHLWWCRCECGSEKEFGGRAIKSGQTKSCGCLSMKFISNLNLTHGMSKSPTYASYASAKNRCNNAKSPKFKDYGARGIRFLYTSFEDFLSDVGYRPKGTSIDRINNDGDYELGNCRWATPLQQGGNQRTNVNIKIGDISRIASRWGSRINDGSKIVVRLNRSGWPPMLSVFGVVPRGTHSSFARTIAEQSIKGKSLQQLADAVGLKYPLGHKFK